MVSTFKVSVNGTSYDVEVDLIGVMPAQSAVATASAVSSSSSKRKRSNNASELGSWDNKDVSTVRSPMAGSVCKVCVNLNDAVESGQVVMLLEAMKMENEITAPCNGVVTRLAVKEGQTVSDGDDLFEVR